MTKTEKILRVDSSARYANSLSRGMADEVVDRLSTLGPVDVVIRDVADGLPFVDEAWVTANFTPPEARTEVQRNKLTQSDNLIEEVKSADTLVISLPVYNFGVPASLKAWIDHIVRAGVTFHYTETGPAPLLENKRAIVLFASGGTPVGSEIDFASTYLRHILGFIGITNVDIIAADAVAQGADEKLAEASVAISKLQAYSRA